MDDRLGAMRLSLAEAKVATVVSAHAPQMTSPDCMEYELYRFLSAFLAVMQKTATFSVYGGFSASEDKNYGQD
ncbi:hypothetical protein SprV_0501990000 [Sparganum proliferum]